MNQARPAVRRVVLNFNSGWAFHRDANAFDNGSNGQWQEVNLPHSVRLEPLNASGGRNYQGLCTYRKRFNLPAMWQECKLLLKFEGAMQTAEVWLNNRKLTTHFGGYTPFTVDIGDSARFGDDGNLLEVRLNNADQPQVPPGKPQRELDFTYFGGLYRNVTLEVPDKLHITCPIEMNEVGGGGVFVRFSKVSDAGAVIHVRTQVRNENETEKSCTITHELLDTDDSLVATCDASQRIAPDALATFSQSLNISRPNLWHPHHPYLYVLRTIVSDERGAVDEQRTRIGIRHIRFDKNAGLFINGERFLSLGANRHQDHPYVGYAMPDSAQYRDVKKLREAGFTSVRSHYPQSPAFMDACDELGMLVIVSNPGWQFVGDAVFQQRAIDSARVMVRRDRNRPSVILWEAALNESNNAALAGVFQEAIHEEYPGDQCYTAGDRERGFAKAGAGWDVEYLHNDGSRPYWIREWGDHVDNWSDQQSNSRVPRGWGEAPMLSAALSHLTRMNEIMVSHHDSNCGDRGSRLSGACLWAGIDYQRGYHHQPFFGGPLDLFRLPKFGHYLFQSQRPADVHVPGLDDGPMVFIANFASFLSPTTVTVFSNCEQARLIQDGKVIAIQEPDHGHLIPHPPFTFQVKRFLNGQSTMYMTGVADVGVPMQELRAEGLVDGKVVATHVVQPPGVAAKIVLEVDHCGCDLVADGADWVRVYARICDIRGTVCPFADDTITFTVDGEGAIIGDERIGANPMRAETGIATALLQSTLRAGKIIVRATAFDLIAGEVEITSRAVLGAAVQEPVEDLVATVSK